MAIVCCWGLGRVAHSRPNLCGSFVGHSRAGHLKQLLGKRSQRDRRIDVAAVAGGNPAVTRRGLALLPALLLASEQLLLAGPAEAATATGTDLTSREQEVADVYDKVAPAVVNIYDITLQGLVPGNPREGPQVEGNGSGFVFDKEGHVVTNYHVLANVLGGAAGKVLPGAKVAQVFLQGPDGIQRAFDGFIVGSDKARDLVVLRIDAPRDQLAPVTLGDSAALRVGQSVLAIGSPFGFGGTLTTGVVSSLGRGFQSLTGSTIGGGIQTDAAINPGNSGGPLLDLKGRVVGVNTAIFTSTGLSVGVGFAIPINTVARVVPQLIDSGRVSRASLGVQIAPDPVARALKVSEGAMIQVVNPDSPAAAAGLLGTRRGLGGIVAGDVIVSLDGRRVRSPFDLSSILDSLTPGRDVTVGVVRGVGQSGSQEVRVEVKLGTEQ